MATATLASPGSVFHVTLSRARNERHRDAARELVEFLARLARLAGPFDVAVLSWAAVPGRVYVGLAGAGDAVRAVAERARSALARSLAGATDPSTAGDLIAGDGPAFVAEMIAFHHNAPVRAGLCASAWDSAMTSHRAYVHLAPRPGFLACSRGLALCGMADTPAGRRQFDEAILLRATRRAPGGLPDDEARTASRGPRPRQDGDVTRPGRRRRADRPPTCAPAQPPAVPRRVVAFAAAALGVGVDELRGPAGAGLQRLGQRASIWCWIERFRGAPGDIAAALSLSPTAVAGELASLRGATDDVARRLGNCLASELAAGDRPRPSVGVPRPTTGGAPAAAHPAPSDYTDVMSSHPPTALSDVLTARRFAATD